MGEPREATEGRKADAAGRFVTDEKGRRVGVILSVEEYEALIDEREDLEDVIAYDEAKAELERGEDELIPFDQAMREIDEGRVEE